MIYRNLIYKATSSAPGLATAPEIMASCLFAPRKAVGLGSLVGFTSILTSRCCHPFCVHVSGRLESLCLMFGYVHEISVDTVVINSITMVFIGGRVVAGSKVEGRSTIELLTTACTFPDHSSLCTSDCSTLCTSLALKTTLDYISMSLVTEPLLKTKTCLITILKPKERAASLKFPQQGENVRFFIWFPDQILDHSCDPMTLLGIANPLFEHVDVRAPGPAIFPKFEHMTFTSKSSS